jgi:ACS family pantothenate transporter-like MFS transporter
MIQSSYWLSYMSLWLKSDPKYSIQLVNILPTFINLISALSSWLGTTLAVTVSVRGLWTFYGVSEASASVLPSYLG